jgi:1-acyl-sn-glycerol-3-phosphate acyltransferase
VLFKRLWRLLVLAACFVAVGTCGVLLTLVGIPLMRLTHRTARQRQLRVRYCIHWVFVALLAVLRATRTMTLDARHSERLRNSRHKLVLANHPSYLDAVVLLAFMPEAGCIVKQGLWRNPCFGGAVRASGYLSNADGDQLIDDCAAALAEGGPLLVFPEGTRTQTGQPLSFLRGAARIALRSHAEIVPVIMECRPSVWGKGFNLWAIAKEQFHITFEVKLPLQLADLGWKGEPEALAARHLTERLEAYFSAHIESHEQPTFGNQETDHRGSEPGRSGAGGHRQRRTSVR